MPLSTDRAQQRPSCGAYKPAASQTYKGYTGIDRAVRRVAHTIRHIREQEAAQGSTHSPADYGSLLCRSSPHP